MSEIMFYAIIHLAAAGMIVVAGIGIISQLKRIAEALEKSNEKK